jgi:phosphoribosyl 1,2-cyclic phosphate phosphodiesterase
VLFTHDHADHTHGIDDIRAISVRRDAPLPFYGSEQTLASLRAKFNYIFDENIRPLPGTAKPEGRAVTFTHGRPFEVAGIEVLPFAVPHGRLTVTGFRIGGLAYITDAKTVPDDVMARIVGVKVLVLNALFRTEHPTHLSIPEALRVAAEVGAERTYLIHLTHDNLHADLEAELPRGVSPAFDGLTVRID